MADTAVGGLPVGAGATVANDQITVSYLLNNPRVIDRRIGEAADFRYFADRILPNVGATGGGVVIFQEWDPRYTVLDRKAEELAPDAEVPLAAGFEGELKVVRAKADGLGYTVSDTQRERNMMFVINRKELALAHSIADNFNARAVKALTDAITAAARTYAATDWSALTVEGSTPSPVANWPHSTLAKINADQTMARVPWRYDAMLAHPLDIWRLKTIYLRETAQQPQQDYTAANVNAALAAKLGLELILEDNTGDVPRGRPILWSQNNVGGTAWERPIKTEIIPERRRLRDVVQSTGSAAYFVDNPHGVLQLTGVATADGGT